MTDGNVDIPVTFGTNAGIVAAEIDKAKTATVGAEVAAKKFNTTHAGGHAIMANSVRGIKGIGQAATLMGSSLGGPIRHLTHFIHTAEMLGGIAGVGVAAALGVGVIAYEQYAKSAEEAEKKIREHNEKILASMKELQAADKSTQGGVESASKAYESNLRTIAFRRGVDPGTVVDEMHKRPNLSADIQAKHLANGGLAKELNEATLAQNIGIDPEKFLERYRQAKGKNPKASLDELFREGEGGRIPGEKMNREEMAAQAKFKLSDRERAASFSEPQFDVMDKATMAANTKAMDDLGAILGDVFKNSIIRAIANMDTMAQEHVKAISSANSAGVTIVTPQQ